MTKKPDTARGFVVLPEDGHPGVDTQCTHRDVGALLKDVESGETRHRMSRSRACCREVDRDSVFLWRKVYPRSFCEEAMKPRARSAKMNIRSKYDVVFHHELDACGRGIQGLHCSASQPFLPVAVMVGDVLRP